MLDFLNLSGRDIQSLIEKHILRKTNEGGRSTHYELIG